MANTNPTIVTAAALVVGVLGAFGALNSYNVSNNYSEQFPDAYGGGVAQVRFAPLLERVPPAATLGYFTDIQPSQKAYESAFLAAQYAVAPRVLVMVDAKTRPEWAVGNFSRPQDFAAAGAAHGYGTTADLGNGVVLFHRGAQ
ncbi:MAG TPA: hypothetical protein VGN17_27285 [Bryobacteraceae bacterium]|jgi:hypothetical protein